MAAATRSGSSTRRFPARCSRSGAATCSSPSASTIAARATSSTARPPRPRARPDIFNVAFDNINALTPKHRTVKAAYAEMLFPILPSLDVIVGRPRRRLYRLRQHGESEGLDQVPARRTGSCSAARTRPASGCRRSTRSSTARPISPNPGNTLVDPTLCPQGTVTGPQPACAPITPDIAERRQSEPRAGNVRAVHVGVVFQPVDAGSASRSTIGRSRSTTRSARSPSRSCSPTSPLFPERIDAHQRHHHPGRSADRQFRLAADRRASNSRSAASSMASAASSTPGSTAPSCSRSARSCCPTCPIPNLVGVFTLTGDLGLKWKHNAFISWRNDDWNFTLTQIFRNGYRNFALPGSATRPDYNPRVERIYHLQFLGQLYRPAPDSG